MKKSYTKNYKTLHANRFLNQKELDIKTYAEKEGINLNTFRRWVLEASNAPTVIKKAPKRVTTKVTTNLSSTTKTLTIAYSIIAVCTLILTCSYLWSLIVK